MGVNICGHIEKIRYVEQQIRATQSTKRKHDLIKHKKRLIKELWTYEHYTRVI